jgi:HK97 family phage major capsid protein
MKSTEFDLLAFIESQQRGGLIGNAKAENQIAQLIRERCPVSRERIGVCLPDQRLLRDLQLATGGLSGANLAGAVHNPLALVAGAARPQLVLERAGVETIQIDDAQEASLPRWRGNGGGWISEGQTLSDAGLTLSSVAVSAHHAGAQLSYSRRLRVGTRGDQEAAVIAEMRRSVAQVVEHGLIQGTGSNGQPLGLLEQATGAVSFAGATPTYLELVSMVEALGDADGDLGRAAWLMHPSMAATLARTERASGTGLMVLEAMALHQWAMVGLPVFATTAMPEGRIVLMEPRAAQVVFFGAPQLLADPFSGSNSTTGATTVIVSNYVDIAVPEPALVVVGSA